tara:strand:+ start:99 stop:506 length:408 start_codon:yes stop_codon:yes gene_type:complete
MKRYPCFRCCFFDQFQQNASGSVSFIKKAMLHWDRQQDLKKVESLKRKQLSSSSSSSLSKSKHDHITVNAIVNSTAPARKRKREDGEIAPKGDGGGSEHDNDGEKITEKKRQRKKDVIRQSNRSNVMEDRHFGYF